MEIELLATVGLGEVFNPADMADEKAWLKSQAAELFRDAMALDSRNLHAGAEVLSREGNRLLAVAATLKN